MTKLDLLQTVLIPLFKMYSKEYLTSNSCEIINLARFYNLCRYSELGLYPKHMYQKYKDQCNKLELELLDIYGKNPMDLFYLVNQKADLEFKDYIQTYIMCKEHELYSGPTKGEEYIVKLEKIESFKRNLPKYVH